MGRCWWLQWSEMRATWSSRGAVPTVPDLDFDLGIALGHILDRSRDFAHVGDGTGRSSGSVVVVGSELSGGKVATGGVLRLGDLAPGQTTCRLSDGARAVCGAAKS